MRFGTLPFRRDRSDGDRGWIAHAARDDPEGGDLRVAPNLVAYESARATFTWDDARRELSGLPGGGLNIAYECVDRHAAGPRRDHLALRWLGRHGERHDLAYGDLEDLTNRFANVLSGLGVARGERVFVLAGRIPGLYVSVLGTLQHGAVACTLFSAFGPEPIRQRLDIGDGRVLVTTEAPYRRKVESIRDGCPSWGTWCSSAREINERSPTEPMTSTSSWTLRRGVTRSNLPIPTTSRSSTSRVRDAVVAHYATGKLALDLHSDDVFWCTADPGWVTGTSYGIVSPLSHGVTRP